MLPERREKADKTIASRREMTPQQSRGIDEITAVDEPKYLPVLAGLGVKTSLRSIQ